MSGASTFFLSFFLFINVPVRKIEPVRPVVLPHPAANPVRIGLPYPTGPACVDVVRKTFP